MAWNSTNVTHKKDIVHNLGYKPIVMAYHYFEEYGLTGWRTIPATCTIALEPGVYSERTIYYEHMDDNIIRFYGVNGDKLIVFLYLEPRKDAWYE